MEDRKALTMKVVDYAARVNIGVNRMRMIAKQEGFPVLRIGRKILIFVVEADAWLRDHAAEIE